MALTKEILVDKIETVIIEDWFSLDVRERIVVKEDGEEISSSFNRYRLMPDHDVNTITNANTKKQFNAMMTAGVKKAYLAHMKTLHPDDY